MGIEVQNAWKQFGGQTIFEGLNLKFPEQGTICLFGASGCGKSTLLNCIAGIIPLDQGKITGVSGKKMAYLFQEDRLLPWATAQENVSIVLQERAIEAEEWLERVGLAGEGRKYPRELSGGMRRRVAIARALAYGGDILLLDEPFRGLDEENRDAAAKLIWKTGTAALKILVTHDRSEAERFGDEVWFLEGPPLKKG